MYCMKCGKQVKETDKFCLYCGAPQNPAPTSAAPKPAEESDGADRDEVIRLVRLAMQGDDSVWGGIYEKTHRYVYYLALKFLRSEQDAQDITQEVYIQLIRSITRLLNSDSFFGWLRSIVYSKCKDLIKKKKPVLIDDYDETALDNMPETGEDFLPDSALDDAETRRMILELVDNLPDAQRQAVVFYYYDEMTVEQIAQLMECPAGTVKSRLNYARKQIKEGVEEHERKGVKLYSMAALPILTILLREQAKTMIVPPEVVDGLSALQRLVAEIARDMPPYQPGMPAPQGVQPPYQPAPPVMPEFSVPGAAGNVAVQTVKAATPLVTKVIAGIAAAAVVVVGGIAVYVATRPSVSGEAPLPAITGSPSQSTPDSQRPTAPPVSPVKVDDRFIAPIEAPKPGSTEISTPEQFWDIRNNLSGDYVLTCDIDLSVLYGGFENGGYWEVIGGESKNEQFSGTLDGQGYVVRGLRTDSEEWSTGGGIFYVNFGVIKNLGIEDSVLYGSKPGPEGTRGSSISGAISSRNNGTIYNSWCTGRADPTILVTAGGLCGENFGRIEYSWYDGELFGEQLIVGGIAGYVGVDGIITGCYTRGLVGTYGCGDSYGAENNIVRAGGIAGHSDGLIENCANYAEVRTTGQSGRAGGIAGQIPNVSGGYNPTDYYPVIRNCLSAGPVHGVESAGGICSDAYGRGEISGCVVTTESITSEQLYMSTAALYMMDHGFREEGMPEIDVFDNFFLETVTVHLRNAEPVTAYQIYAYDFYAGIGWDFINYWAMDCVTGLPIVTVTGGQGDVAEPPPPAANEPAVMETINLVESETTYNRDGSIFEWTEYTYDTQGNLLNQKASSADGRTLFWLEHTYDAQGIALKSTNYDSNGSILNWDEYTYDAQGQLLSETTYDSNGSISARRDYDAQGNSISLTFYNSDGSIDRWFEYAYNTEGNILSSAGYNSDGSASGSGTEYIYDVQGNLQSLIIYGGNGSILNREEYTYDAQGNRLSFIYYHADGSIALWFEYTYDEQGKLLRSTNYNRDGNTAYWNEYVYDAQGELLRDTRYSSGGSAEKWTDYTYISMRIPQTA